MSESFDAPLSSGGAAAPERTGLVWVVDDDDVRESLSFALRPRFEIETFPSLAAFLKGADVSTPGCLVIADSMAAIGSRTVLEELAQLKSPVSVVFLSEETDVRTAVEMLQSGAVSVLEKPVDPEELSRDVERALERSTRLERRAQVARVRADLLAKVVEARAELLKAFGPEQKYVLESFELQHAGHGMRGMGPHGAPMAGATGPGMTLGGQCPMGGPGLRK